MKPRSNRSRQWRVVGVVVLILTACAPLNGHGRSLGIELAQGGANEERFDDVDDLNSEQREKLRVLYLQTEKDFSEIRFEMDKLKAMLARIFNSQLYNSREAATIKTKVVDLEQKRVSLIFRSLADVQLIVGIGRDKEVYYQHFFESERRR